jgi:hypothetical protein
MSKLFIFGIGGTGSRVIKALTMLMASGVEMPNTSEIVPIIIDPDAQNGDMTRTVALMNDYIRIRSSVEHTKNQFFKTKISTLKSLLDASGVATALAETFQYDINGTKAGRFRDFIDYSGLDEADKAMVDLLYSDDNLNLSLDEGFKGNPNIGAIVLNQFKYSDELKQFASQFRDGDRIFIISSIFGGTGAAGFPLLLKNLRNADTTLANHASIKNAPIGAVTVMPYFGVDPKAGGKIDKGTFISKTKSALSYYYRTISQTGALNSFYYVGDTMSQDYNYAEGRTAQMNRAHLVEMIAALGIVNFANMPAGDLTCRDGRADKPVANEYGVKTATSPMRFEHLPDETRALLLRPMTQFGYFALYLQQQFAASLGKQPWSSAGKNKLDSFFTSQPYFAAVRSFTNQYWAWLTEMAQNERSFAPFDMATTEASLYKFVVGVEQKAGFLGLNRSWSYSTFDDKLNEAEQKIGDLAAEQKFMAVFYKATEEIFKQKFG